MEDARTIRQLDDIAELLTHRLNEVAYVTVAERYGTREEQLVKLKPTEAIPYETLADTQRRAAAFLARLEGELRGLADGPHSPFRVAVYAEKGEKLLTRSVSVVDAGVAVSGQPSIEEIATEVEGRALHSLGAAYRQFSGTVMTQAEQFGALCLRQMKSVDEISRTQAELTAKETEAARAQVTELVREVSKAKVTAAENQVKVMAAEAMNEVAEQRKQVEAERSLAGQDLAKEAINRLGELGQAFVTTKLGMPTELAEVSAALQSSPAMMEALRDPKVREQLKSPENLDYLSAMLKQAAAVTPEAATQDTPPPSPSGSEPSE